VRSAPRLYRLLLALGGLVVLAIAATVGAAASATSVRLPTVHDLTVALLAGAAAAISALLVLAASVGRAAPPGGIRRLVRTVIARRAS
jgi:hypothetical protein